MLILLSGCSNETSSVVRIDIKPINSRFVGLGNPTNICWIGELLTNNSWLSVPCKSAYRVRCCVRNISESCSSIGNVNDWVEIVAPSNMPNGIVDENSQLRK